MDLFVANNYALGNISDGSQYNVYTAIMVFFVIGLYVTILCGGLYPWRVHFHCKGDVWKDESHAAINLWISLAKVGLEAFPQSTITSVAVRLRIISKRWFYIAFDVFSIVPLIMFVCYTFYYCCTLEKGPNLAMRYL